MKQITMVTIILGKFLYFSLFIRNFIFIFYGRYELSDGQTRDETGTITKDEDDLDHTVNGSYSFVGDDGVTYSVDYSADKTGFHASGEHLPKNQVKEKPAALGYPGNYFSSMIERLQG